MPNAMMHDPAKSEADMLGALADAVEDMKMRKADTPEDKWPDTIRAEGKMSADAVRSSAKECAQRIVDAANAVVARAQMDLEQANSHASEIISRAEIVATSIEGHAETDARVATAMAQTIQLILPPVPPVKLSPGPITAVDFSSTGNREDQYAGDKITVSPKAER